MFGCHQRRQAQEFVASWFGYKLYGMVNTRYGIPVIASRPLVSMSAAKELVWLSVGQMEGDPNEALLGVQCRPGPGWLAIRDHPRPDRGLPISGRTRVVRPAAYEVVIDKEHCSANASGSLNRQVGQGIFKMNIRAEKNPWPAHP